MREIWNNLVAHLRADLSIKTYGATLGFLAALLFVNYYFQIESQVLAHLSAGEYLFYTALLFFGSYYIAVLIKSGAQPFKDRGFIQNSLIILTVASLASSLLFVLDWTKGLDPFEAYYLNKLLLNSMGSVIVFVGLGALYLLNDRSKLDHFYGMRWAKEHSLIPYLALLTLMAPLLFWASLQPHFLDTYPIFRAEHYRTVFGLDLSTMAVLFESVYLFDFIRIELLFRGALVIGLARFLGKDTVLTMTVLYCVLHFNKPLGEAVSSIFGGYILGVIALYQRHIIGGCIVHIGIAGIMELFAYLASA